MTTTKKTKALDFNSAEDIKNYVTDLISRHEGGIINDEDFDRRHGATRTLAKVHGDVVRDRAVVVAAKSQGMSVSDLPSFFGPRVRALPAKG
jgi:hypothetical protein